MPLLKDILLGQQTIYQEALANTGFSLLDLLYSEDDVANPNTHINGDNALLLIYLLSTQAGLDNAQEIEPAIAEKVQLFTLGFIPGGAKESDFIKVAKANSNFKKVVDSFLVQESTDIKSLIIAVSEESSVNNSHFSSFTLKKVKGKLFIAIKDSILAAHHFESPEFNNLKKVIETVFPAPTYQVEVLRAPTASQDAADCLIHALHNTLKDTLGDKYQLNLTPEIILQIRKQLSLFLKDGHIPEHNTQQSTISEPGSKKVGAEEEMVEAFKKNPFKEDDYFANTPLTEYLATRIFVSDDQYDALRQKEILDVITKLCKLAETDKSARALLTTANNKNDMVLNTPLMLLVKAGHLEAVKLLAPFYTKDELMQTTPRGNSVFHIAAITGQGAILEVIKKRACELNIWNECKTSKNKASHTAINMLNTLCTRKSALFANILDFSDPFLGGESLIKRHAPTLEK